MVNENKFIRFLVYQAPAIVLALVIFILSSIPDLPSPKLEIKFHDKIAHFFIYAILGLLISRAFLNQHRFPRWRKSHTLIALILGVLYGISDEYHQLYVPGRSADVLDVVADSLGVIAGVIIFRFKTTSQRISSIAR